MWMSYTNLIRFMLLYSILSIRTSISHIVNPFRVYLQPLQICAAESIIDLNASVALILARGGSKGIPLKNLATVNGLSLLARAILVANNADVFTDIWVSTDNSKIAREAKLFGAKVHYRPNHLAADETASIDAVGEFLEKHQNISNIALIQCTSVFLAEEYLKRAATLFQSTNVECVFSTVRSWKLRWTQANRQVMPINFDAKNRPRRQDWNGELLEAGMFYFARRHLIEKDKLFQNNRCKVVEIRESDALEIDTVFHLKLAEILMQLQSI